MKQKKSTIKILSIAGARPNFMKIAPIADALGEHNLKGLKPIFNHVIVHTGQHYDERMSKLFFDELGIPKPKYNLEVGSGSHAFQTAEIMKRIEPVIINEAPDYVLVVGDVNSTIACALVAKKLGVKVIHVEAGLRSFDMEMPEEINRILTDSISDMLFVTEPSGEVNLLRSGIAKEKIYFIGNVMIDTLLKHRQHAESSHVHKMLNLVKKGKVQPYAVLTLHRPSNVDVSATLKGIIGAINEIAQDITVIFPVHPRTKRRIAEENIPILSKVQLIEPLGYLDFLKLTAYAHVVLTDSGGIQEETTVLGVPCITIRNNTERPVTVKHGTNHLAGIESESILITTRQVLRSWKRPDILPELWDGKSSRRLLDVLVNERVEECL